VAGTRRQRRRLAALRWKRLLALAVLIALALSGLAVRLGFVQLVRHRELAEAAVLQRAQTVPLGPTRGRILDRDGVPLTDSLLTYRVAVYPAFFPPGSQRAAQLASLLELEATELDARLEAGGGPIFVVTGLTLERAAVVAGLGLEGLAVVADERRYGPEALASHAVGYWNGAVGDGLEKAWDSYLGGRGPELLALFVDGRGQPLASLGWRKLAWSGDSPWTALPCDLVTTIDSEVQRAVEEVMDGSGPGVRRGAVVVMDPWRGDVLALASRPDYDQGRVADYLDRSDGPLVNRALSPYPAGSVIKSLVLAAALETGVVDRREVFECRGLVRVAGREVGCSARATGGHGSLTVEEALAVSCNCVFVELWERLGQDGLRDWASRLGLGRTCGIGLAGESAGALPRPAEDGPEPEAAFGQGSLLVTPLQVARAYSAIANGGRLVLPRLVLELRSPVGAEAGLSRRGANPSAVQETGRVIAKWAAADVTRGLLEAVRRGTGQAAGVRGDVAGKTGTAETGRTGEGGEELYDAWFAGFWPAHNPRYVIVVLIEDTPAGGAEAAAVFGAILDRIAGVRP
jgi:cell division protein FtsI/penicillin-binding protein 2